MPEQPPMPPIAESRVIPKRQTRLSLVWIIPILAAVVGAWVAATRIMSEGQEISIEFNSAEGLQAGKTKIHYKGVEVGTLETIRLSEDHRHVIATVQMAPKTGSFLVQDTQFWVVRPRISGATVTGLGTLISGAYVGMEIGHSKTPKRKFVALETPPVVTGGVPGRFFALKTPTLGSLDVGTPVFFRRLQVGEVAAYKLDPDGRLFTLKIFIRAPYDQFVASNTRFWQASGVNLKLSADGLTVRTQSLLSILVGGIAFATPETATALPAAAANTTFTLFVDRAKAFAPPLRNAQTYQLIFNESVRGLEPGAPVEFRGVKIGEVTAIRAQINAKNFEYSVPVTVRLNAEQLGVKIVGTNAGVNFEAMRKKLVDSLVAHGARAQLQTGSLITGSAFVAIDFFPDAPPARIDWSQDPPRLPTIPGALAAAEMRLAHIAQKLDEMPLKKIGDNLNNALVQLDLTLAGARSTLASAQTTLSNVNQIVQPDSAQGQQLSNALSEVSRAARSLRVLSDYLEQHPEALVRGKPGHPK
jgi:paraquat-inducible protein B